MEYRPAGRYGKIRTIEDQKLPDLRHEDERKPDRQHLRQMHQSQSEYKTFLPSRWLQRPVPGLSQA